MVQELETGGIAIKTAFKEVSRIQRDFRQKDPMYADHEYQAYVASKLLATQGKLRMAKLASGQGKTYIMMLMAMQLAESEIEQIKSIFYVPEEYLA